MLTAILSRWGFSPTNYRVRTSLLILSGRRDFAFRVRVPMGCRHINFGYIDSLK